ncbi:hypothetical protein BDZ89DRAFT_1066974 [Hymenopellis radicata]|nr:hypothetical protein BDZ89DRAFT_1066974 [Hymenopellis radicata]
MFKLTIAFLALLSSTALATSALAPVPANTGVAQAPDAITIFTGCNDLSLSGTCFDWTSTVLPSGCGDFRSSGQDDQLTSARSAPGIQCTLFADPGCTGRSQLIVGTVNDLRTVGFDDTATSFNCRSL